MQDMMLLDRRMTELVREYVPEGDVLDSITCFFAVFADPTRVRMLSALAISEMCVTCHYVYMLSYGIFGDKRFFLE